jgi:hypothetical protein
MSAAVELTLLPLMVMLPNWPEVLPIMLLPVTSPVTVTSLVLLNNTMLLAASLKNKLPSAKFKANSPGTRFPVDGMLFDISERFNKIVLDI